MDQEYKRKLVRRAELEWGTSAQKIMVMEECAELIAAISQHSRDRIGLHELADEVADVEIMLDFMRLYLGDENVDRAVELKLERLAGLLPPVKGSANVNAE